MKQKLLIDEMFYLSDKVAFRKYRLESYAASNNNILGSFSSPIFFDTSLRAGRGPGGDRSPAFETSPCPGTLCFRAAFLQRQCRGLDRQTGPRNRWQSFRNHGSGRGPVQNRQRSGPDDLLSTTVSF